MANDIHVWLLDDEAALLRKIAKCDGRSITNMARTLMREALKARGLSGDDRPSRVSGGAGSGEA